MDRKPRLPPKPHRPALAAALAAGLLASPLFAAPTRAATLISAEEASLPPAAFPPQTRGITRGPAMKLESPEGPVASPFKLLVSFAAFGGAQIVPGSIKLTYLRNPSVDLTGRIKAYITPQGIGITAAEAPPGKHDLMLEAADSNQRVVKLPITIVVEPKK